MTQIVKGTWEFSHNGEVFAVITNTLFKDVYFLHLRGKALQRVNGSFMTIVAKLLPVYAEILESDSEKSLECKPETVKFSKGDKVVRTTLSNSWKKICKKAKKGVNQVLTVKDVLIYGINIMLSLEGVQGKHSQDNFKKVD